MENIKIPIALQLVVDDVGWHHGPDERHLNRPARTGINRDHEVEDYIVLNEIGKKLDMHVLCGFTIGEWDKDNILRGMKHATWDEENWDRASEIDYEKAGKFFEAIENSQYIDLAFHGLMHGYWEDGKNFGSSRELFRMDHEKMKKENFPGFPALPFGGDYPVLPVSAEYVDEHLDAWFKIYNSWGFTKKIDSMILPASLYKDKEVPDSYARVAKKYGIKFWKNFWHLHPSLTAFFEGITFINSAQPIEWNCFDIDPEKDLKLPVYNEPDRPEVYSSYGCHWANFVCSDPKENVKHVDGWVKKIKEHEKVFGRMLSKNMAFACHQAQYHAYTKMTFKDNVLTLDVTDVLNSEALSKSDEFYISIKNELKPISIDGGSFELYDTQEDFKTYKIGVKDNIIKIQMT